MAENNEAILFRLSVENERADAGGRDGRPCLAKPNSQARTGVREEVIFHVEVTADHKAGLGHTRLTHTLQKCWASLPIYIYYIYIYIYSYTH